MDKLTQHRGKVALLPGANIDTDAIIPSREMKRVSKIGLGEGLFAGWRYLSSDSRELNPEFVLNKPQSSAATVLLAGTNFGCGSSREHAVWALQDYGFRVIIAASFGSIFQANCYRNGLLAIALDAAALQAISQSVEADPSRSEIEVDLETQTILSPSGLVYHFSIPADARQRLIDGADEIDQTLQFKNEIESFRKQRATTQPWVNLDSEYEANHPELPTDTRNS